MDKAVLKVLLEINDPVLSTHVKPHITLIKFALNPGTNTTFFITFRLYCTLKITAGGGKKLMDQLRYAKPQKIKPATGELFADSG